MSPTVSIRIKMSKVQRSPPWTVRWKGDIIWVASLNLEKGLHLSKLKSYKLFTYRASNSKQKHDTVSKFFSSTCYLLSNAHLSFSWMFEANTDVYYITRLNSLCSPVIHPNKLSVCWDPKLQHSYIPHASCATDCSLLIDNIPSIQRPCKRFEYSWRCF